MALRPRLVVVALVALSSCFVDAPPVTSDTGTCTEAENACACESMTCEESDGDATDGRTQSDGHDDDVDDTAEDADDTADATSVGDGSTTADPTTDASSDDGTTDGTTTASDTTTGAPGCAEMACAACVACVDSNECAVAHMNCGDTPGCAFAVDCLVDCGLNGDCLDPCCVDLDADAREIVDTLMLCKRDECVDPCDMEAELDVCPT